jgi:hypothetical protein
MSCLDLACVIVSSWVVFLSRGGIIINNNMGFVVVRPILLFIIIHLVMCLIMYLLGEDGPSVTPICLDVLSSLFCNHVLMVGISLTRGNNNK